MSFLPCFPNNHWFKIYIILNIFDPSARNVPYVLFNVLWHCIQDLQPSTSWYLLFLEKKISMSDLTPLIFLLCFFTPFILFLGILLFFVNNDLNFNYGYWISKHLLGWDGTWLSDNHSGLKAPKTFKFSLILKKIKVQKENIFYWFDNRK
jgi:hypothetical protein